MEKGRIAAILVYLAATVDVLASGPGQTHLYPAPSPLNVVSLAGDRHGLIWVAAKEGIFRFDGLHYHAIPGYPFRGARFVAAEPKDAVWAGSPQGLARYENSEWKVVLPEPVEAMAMSPAGLWVNAGGLRLISPDGAERRFVAKPTGELLVDGGGALWFPCGERVCTMRPPDWGVESQKNPAEGNWIKVVPEKGGRRYWVSSFEEVAAVEDGAVLSRQKAGYPPDLTSFSPPLDPDLSPGGTVWGSRPHLQPLAGLRLWQTGTTSGTCSFFSGESTRWFCAGDKVGKSVLDTDWETWTGQRFDSISPEGFLARPGRTPLIFTSRGVLDLNEGAGNWQKGPTPPTLDIMNIAEDGYGGHWLATRDAGLVRTGKGLEVIERFPNMCPTPDWMRGLLRDGRGRTWAGGKDLNCFFEVQGGPGRWKFVPQKLPGATQQTVDLHTDGQGRPWVGYEYGIAYLDDSGDWRRIKTSEPVTLVRAFEFDGKDAIWVAHRRPGFFTRLERKGDLWQVRRFAGDEYGPGHTEYLKRDSRGWIWRGDSVGGAGGAPRTVRTQGLAAAGSLQRDGLGGGESQRLERGRRWECVAGWECRSYPGAPDCGMVRRTQGEAAHGDAGERWWTELVRSGTDAGRVSRRKRIGGNRSEQHGRESVSKDALAVQTGAGRRLEIDRRRAVAVRKIGARSLHTGGSLQRARLGGCFAMAVPDRKSGDAISGSRVELRRVGISGAGGMATAGVVALLGAENNLPIGANGSSGR